MSRLLKSMAGLALCALVVTATAARAELAVIAHPDVKVEGLSKDYLRQIYLDKTSRYPSGQEAIPVDQASGAPMREKFYQDVVGKSAREVDSYWSRRVFTGKGDPPRELQGDRSVKDFVAGTRGALGYVEGEHVDSSVKVLLILP